MLFNEGRHAGAEAEYRQALRLAPENASASSWLSKSLYAQGRHIEAEVAARDAIRADPGLGMAHVSLGRALHRLGQTGFLAGLISGQTFADMLTGTIVIWRPTGVTTRSRRKIAAMEREDHRKLKRNYRRAGRFYFFLNVVMLEAGHHPLRHPARFLFFATRRRPKRDYDDDPIEEDGM